MSNSAKALLNLRFATGTDYSTALRDPINLSVEETGLNLYMDTYMHVDNTTSQEFGLATWYNGGSGTCEVCIIINDGVSGTDGDIIVDLTNTDGSAISHILTPGQFGIYYDLNLNIAQKIAQDTGDPEGVARIIAWGKRS